MDSTPDDGTLTRMHKFPVFKLWPFAVAFIAGGIIVAQNLDVKLSPDAACKIQIANLKQQVAGLESMNAELRKQLADTEANQTRGQVLTAECELAKIPLSECKYDPVKGSVFRMPDAPAK